MDVREKIQEIEKKSVDGDYIYRGEPEHYEENHGRISSSLWRLSVKHLRLNRNGGITFSMEDMQTLILKEVRRYTESDKNDFELLSEIQHYGGATNLIDFTIDYRIALFFACDGFPSKSGRVILLSRTPAINEKYSIKEPRGPERRSIAQKSIFVQPPHGIIGDEDYYVIDIPKDLKTPILRHLRQHHGIFTRKIYNDLQGYIKYQGIHQEAYIHLASGIFDTTQGRLSEEENYYDSAIMEINEAIKLNPDFAEAYHNRGQVYWRQGDYPRAINDFTMVIQLDPNFVEAYHNRGQVYWRQENYPSAINDFNRAVQLDPNNHLFRDSRSLIQERLKKLYVIGRFVAHLRSTGHPNLQIDRSPDIDAVAGHFAIEHIRIDTLPDQTRRNDWFGQAIDGLEEELSPYLPFRLQITLQYDAVTANQDWRAINRALMNWIMGESVYLEDGQHDLENVPSIPFPLNVDKDSDYKFPGLVFYRNQPNDNTLPNRIKTLCDEKARKLAEYQESGKTTVILIENNDIALMNRTMMRQEIQNAYPNGLPAGVDKIWFADTTGDSDITFEDFTP